MIRCYSYVLRMASNTNLSHPLWWKESSDNNFKHDEVVYRFQVLFTRRSCSRGSNPAGGALVGVYSGPQTQILTVMRDMMKLCKLYVRHPLDSSNRVRSS